MTRPYQPRFSAVTRLRESQRDDKRLQVAEALKAETILHEQQQQISLEIKNVINDRREAANTEGIDPNHFIASQRYEANLRAQQKQVVENLSAVGVEMARRQQELVQAEREVRTIEKLEERGKENHKKEEQRLEQRDMDEVASRTTRYQQDLIDEIF